MDGQNGTFWLHVTNLALGVVVFVPLLMVFGAVVWELIDRRVHPVTTDGDACLPPSESGFRRTVTLLPVITDNDAEMHR